MTRIPNITNYFKHFFIGTLQYHKAEKIINVEQEVKLSSFADD